MNLWQTLLRPDAEELENLDRRQVGCAANLLQVGEFQLLQLAYREWFGHDLPPVLVDRMFTSYMVHGQVPHWARDYARRILELAAEDNLDDASPAFHRYDHQFNHLVPDGVRRFIAAVAVLTIAMTAFVAGAELTATVPGTLFPPYIEITEPTPVPDILSRRIP